MGLRGVIKVRRITLTMKLLLGKTRSDEILVKSSPAKTHPEL